MSPKTALQPGGPIQQDWPRLWPVHRSHTSAILLMFSLRSFSEKPKSLFKPKRTLSPSSRYAEKPRCRRCCSSAFAIVDLPDAESPVNHIVNPHCLRKVFLSCRDNDGCHVILLRLDLELALRRFRKPSHAKWKSEGAYPRCHSEIVWRSCGGTQVASHRKAKFTGL